MATSAPKNGARFYRLRLRDANTRILPVGRQVHANDANKLVSFGCNSDFSCRL